MLTPELPDDPVLAHVDSFFIKIATDFVKHNPEKLESTLVNAYQAGYQAGLWDAVDNIRSMPGWQDEDE